MWNARIEAYQFLYLILSTLHKITLHNPHKKAFTKNSESFNINLI